jgi:hypothetical protein
MPTTAHKPTLVEITGFPWSVAEAESRPFPLVASGELDPFSAADRLIDG